MDGLVAVLKVLVMLAAAASFLVVSAAVLIAVHRGRRVVAHWETRLGTMDLTLAEISKSTNGVKPGEPTLIDQVREVRSTIAALQQQFLDAPCLNRPAG
jgi:hypothetical protein